MGRHTDAAARREVGIDGDPARLDDGEEVARDAHDERLVERADLLEALQPELEAFRLDQRGERLIADRQRGEVGLAGDGTAAREVRHVEGDVERAGRRRPLDQVEIGRGEPAVAGDGDAEILGVHGLNSFAQRAASVRWRRR